MISPVPQGRYAVAVSGGADSVCLLHLLMQQKNLQLHVVHLDHQTRGAESTADAEFVRHLAGSLHVPATIRKLDEVAREMKDLPGNPSAKYRAVRYRLFEDVAAQHQLDGVILAHHADDQAETILHRLLRGSGLPSLGGMRECSTRNNLAILRPMLHLRRRDIENYLRQRNLEWREDSSNVSDQYARNRLRKVLRGREELHEALIELGEKCSAWNTWLEEKSPRLPAEFAIRDLADLPLPLAQRAASKWLKNQGASSDDLSAQVLDRLIDMASDAATPSRQQFPGNLLVHRRAGNIRVS